VASCLAAFSAAPFRLGSREFRAKWRIAFDVIIEGLFTEWPARQARRFGKDVSAVERKLVATATLDGA
jgi:hypothetical protein